MMIEAPVKRLSARKDIEQRSGKIIEDAERLIENLERLDAFAKNSGRPHMHFFCFKRDIQNSVSCLKRMLR